MHIATSIEPLSDSVKVVFEVAQRWVVTGAVAAVSASHRPGDEQAGQRKSSDGKAEFSGEEARGGKESGEYEEFDPAAGQDRGEACHRQHVSAGADFR